jgi:hypothetical protein
MGSQIRTSLSRSLEKDTSMAIFEALLRTATEVADSRKAMGSLVGSVGSAISAIVLIPDPTIKGITIAICTALIVAFYVLGQAIVDAAKVKSP